MPDYLTFSQVDISKNISIVLCLTFILFADFCANVIECSILKVVDIMDVYGFQCFRDRPALHQMEIKEL